MELNELLWKCAALHLRIAATSSQLCWRSSTSSSRHNKILLALTWIGVAAKMFEVHSASTTTQGSCDATAVRIGAANSALNLADSGLQKRSFPTGLANDNEHSFPLATWKIGIVSKSMFWRRSLYQWTRWYTCAVKAIMCWPHDTTLYGALSQVGRPRKVVSVWSYTLYWGIPATVVLSCKLTYMGTIVDTMTYSIFAAYRFFFFSFRLFHESWVATADIRTKMWHVGILLLQNSMARCFAAQRLKPFKGSSWLRRLILCQKFFTTLSNSTIFHKKSVFCMIGLFFSSNYQYVQASNQTSFCTCLWKWRKVFYLSW